MASSGLPPFLTDVDGAVDFITSKIAPLGLDKVTRQAALDYLGKETVQQVESWANGQVHPMVVKANFPLFNVWTVGTIISAYLAILLALRIIGFVLPASFGKSKPFKLVQVVHNVILISTSFWCAFNCYQSMKAGGYGPIYNDVHSDANGKRAFKVLYLCWLLRIYEFVDTFLILLKKSYRQASFLHIYHHASVLGYIWFGVWAAPNGDTVFPCFLNSCVHVVMYTYYLAASLNIRMPFKYSITIMQLLQFVWITTIFVARVVSGRPGYPRSAALATIGYMATMLTLFSNFLIKGLRAPTGFVPESPATPPEKAIKGGKGAKRE